jgi:polyribonucleotide nucleotidyltransferase
MGLIMGDDGKYKVLTDIAGQEDFMGDMDFKVAGTADGITALQMDIKIGGVSHELLEQVLAQAREARLEILRAMHEVIEAPRESVSVYAPKMTVIQIKTDQIGLIIGPGGKMIRKIQEESGGTSIDIEEDGTVVVGGVDSAAVDRAVAMIQGLTKEVTVGEIYTGPVTRLLNFGAFVEILPGKEGLVHISELSDEHVDRVEDVANVGDQLTVMVTEIDNLGRVNLSVRAAASGEIPAPTGDRGGRGGGGRPRGRRDNGGGGGDRGGDRDRGPRPADRGGDRAPRDFDGGDRRGGRRGGGGGGGGGGAGRGRSGPGGGGDFQRSDRSPSLGGASRGWTRRANPPADENAPPAPPPPPRRGFGGFGSYDD